MKNLLALLAASMALPAAAQDTAGKAWRDAPARFRNDISVFTSGGGPGTNDVTQSSGGLIFRRRLARDPQRFWYAGFATGAGSYNDGATRVIPVSADTALLVRGVTNERRYYGLAGTGIERPFWRNLHVTASLEGQLGYGDGTRDSIVQLVRRGVMTERTDEQFFRGADVGDVTGKGLLVVGFRAYAGRLTAAIEGYSGFSAGMRWSSYSIFDFALGGLGARLSAGVRF